MKLATMISSIRRNAWKTCRSCWPASDSMCADSPASARAAGCSRSPRSVAVQADLPLVRGDAAGAEEVVDPALAGRDRPDERRHRSDRDHGENPFRVPRRGLQRIEPAHRCAGEHRLADACRVEHRDRVGDDLTVAVGLRRRRSVRAAVPPRVEGDPREMPGQIGHLGLPLPRVHHLPGRQQQDRRLPGPDTS